MLAGHAGTLALETDEPRLAWSLRIAAARVIMADMEAQRRGDTQVLYGIELDEA